MAGNARRAQHSCRHAQPLPSACLVRPRWRARRRGPGRGRAAAYRPRLVPRRPPPPRREQ
ncbi:MAG: hypothetical protein EOP67_32795 [Sphingomonas sp.]|nr:MAG: hypothetical protein EOP67_32795 [Sphingomonas sp.]